MADYLIGLAVGPVQGFIAAARRTRDLWFGSQILSEVSKAAARQFQSDQCDLIFPAPNKPDELQPGSPLNVGNKLMVKRTTDDPMQFIIAAKESARLMWKQHAKQAYGELKVGVICDDIWKVQVEDVIELYGAWVKIGPEGYGTARKRLERLMGARKSTRNFIQTATSFNQLPGYGLPKSSLDAARETVFTEDLMKEKRFLTDRRKLGLSAGEHLDCPGLVKRLGCDPEQFPPVTRIALEAWLRNINAQQLGEVRSSYEKLVKSQLATRVKAKRFDKLPFDGQLLYPARIESVRKDLGENETEALEALKIIKSAVSNLHRLFGEPTPYFAVLVADGDKMGAFIDDHDRESDHINITRALAGFASKAREIVENHQGASVYTGGDDVLGLLPVHTAVACARALHDEFVSTMQQLGIISESLPSLSVGLGLGHVLTPFNRLLDLGRRAEKLAKEGPEGTEKNDKRNALALIVGVRSGAEISVRGQWNQGLDGRLLEWMALYQQDKISDKTPYDLRLALGRVEWAKARPDFAKIAAQEARRVLTKKRAERGTKEFGKEEVELITQAIKKVELEPLVSELLVARWLSEKAKE